MSDDEKRVVAHPRHEAKARSMATTLGIKVQVTDLCPPNSIYVLDPSPLLDDEDWERGLGRIDFDAIEE